MDVEQSTTPRISRMDLTYLALFALLSVSFFHQAVRNRAEQSSLMTLILVVGGIAWLVFTVLILLGQASGF